MCIIDISFCVDNVISNVAICTSYSILSTSYIDSVANSKNAVLFVSVIRKPFWNNKKKQVSNLSDEH